MAESIKSSGTRILLIRHGETDWNRIHRFQGRSDVPLNQKGREQARALALALKHEPITAIYSSPLVRAIETARLIKMFHVSTPFFEEEALIEMDLGDFDGMEAKRWAAQFQDFRKAWQENPASVKMPGGESLKDVQTRAIDALERITNIYPPGSTLLICGHNFVNLTILCHALEISLNRFRDLQQDTAGISVLYKQGYRLWAEVVNDRSHLQKYKEYEAR
ncbi:MAG: histidine phosphatase family protein [Deltaproteobacteria bacterium]|nr:histidine phosphatase family protein [Deltaproteobacteria bacterium]